MQLLMADISAIKNCNCCLNDPLQQKSFRTCEHLSKIWVNDFLARGSKTISPDFLKRVCRHLSCFNLPFCDKSCDVFLEINSFVTYFKIPVCVFGKKGNFISYLQWKSKVYWCLFLFFLFALVHFFILSLCNWNSESTSTLVAVAVVVVVVIVAVSVSVVFVVVVFVVAVVIVVVVVVFVVAVAVVVALAVVIVIVVVVVVVVAVAFVIVAAAVFLLLLFYWITLC